MFKIRREHMEAFRPVVRAQLPERILADLQKQGTRAERDPASGAIVATDPRGFQTRLAFAPDGLPARLTQPSGTTYAFEHDPEGRLTALIHPGGERVEMKRDTRGNILELRRPGLLSYELEHDENDRLLSARYPDGSTVRLTYHPEGQPDTLTDRTGATTYYQRDLTGKLQSIIDPLGRETKYETDEEARLSSVRFPDGSRLEYAFDPERRVAAITMPDGSTLLQELDDKDRITALTWGADSRVEFEFDSAGNLVVARNESGEIVQSFDAAGNPLTESSGDGTVTYDYDPQGRLVRLVTPRGDSIEYEYDGNGRIGMVRDWAGRENRIVYAPNGTVAEIRYGNGLIEKQQQARIGRLQNSVLIDRSNRVIGEQAYDYDLCERLTVATDVWGSLPSQRSARKFTYDAESRLTSEVDADSRRILAQYRYDAKGNLIEDSGKLIEIGLRDEIIGYEGNSVEYDGNGCMLRLPGMHGEISCDFSPNGTLRTASIGGKTFRYEYDALGRRITKTDGQSTWRYGWACHQLLWEDYQAHPGVPTQRRDYLYLPDSVTPLAFRENGRTYWLQVDARGAVHRALTEDGRVAWHAVYDAFGNARVGVAEIRQPWRLYGQYEDPESSLHYNTARYYSPFLKSYLSLDPNWHRPEATNYSYARNDPWNRVDPLGAIAPLLLGIGAIALGAVVGAAVALATGKDPVAGAVSGGIIAAGAVIASVLAVGAGVAALIGIAATGIGTFAGSLVEQARRGDPLCFMCAAREAIEAMIFDALFLGAGKVVGLIPGVRNLRSLLASKLEQAGATAVRSLTRKEVGDLGEKFVIQKLEREGYTEIKQIKNASGHGIDIIAKNKNGERAFFEVKTNTTGIPGNLSKAQSNPDKFIRERLETAASGEGRWKNVPKETVKELKQIRSDITGKSYEKKIYNVYLSKDGGLNKIESTSWIKKE